MLHNVKVLSFCHYLMGPSASQMLADLGADVIKIEATKGAFERSWAGIKAFKNDVSMFFLLANRNTRSLALDLKAEEGKEVVYKLVKDVDVVIENFRAGVMDKLGFSYEKLKEINPRLIYCTCTGYGSTGPYSDRPGQDTLIQSFSGMVSMNGHQGSGPISVGSSIVDTHGGVLAVVGILASLMDRDVTGKGHKVDVSMLSAAMNLQQEGLAYYLSLKDKGVAPKASDTGLSSRISPSPYGIYQTADGYLTLSMNKHDNLVKIFEPGVLDGYSDNDQVFRRDEYDAIVSAQLKKKTTAEWIAIMRPIGIWHAEVNTYEQLEKDPQVAWNQSILTMQHPKAGEVKVLSHPVRYDNETLPLRRLPPDLGEHSAEILKAIGYDENDVAKLREKNIIS